MPHPGNWLLPCKYSITQWQDRARLIQDRPTSKSLAYPVYPFCVSLYSPSCSPVQRCFFTLEANADRSGARRSPTPPPSCLPYFSFCLSHSRNVCRKYFGLPHSCNVFRECFRGYVCFVVGMLGMRYHLCPYNSVLVGLWMILSTFLKLLCNPMFLYQRRDIQLCSFCVFACQQKYFLNISAWKSVEHEISHIYSFPFVLSIIQWAKGYYLLIF